MAASRRRIEQEEARESKRKYLEILGHRALEDRIVDTFRERVEAFAPSLQTPPPILWPATKVGKRPESAVLVLSDTHIGQVVNVEQTNGFGNYNPRIYCERLYYVQEKVLEVISQTPAGIDELVVLILGDIVHGALHHGAEREDHAAIADQYQLAVWTITSVPVCFGFPGADRQRPYGSGQSWSLAGAKKDADQLSVLELRSLGLRLIAAFVGRSRIGPILLCI